VCLAALLFSAPLQLYLLNMTLASGRATFTIPLYLSLTMLLTSASGGILFSEFAAVAHRAPAPLWLVMYGVAVLIVLCGLVVLSSRPEAQVAQRRLSSRRRHEEADEAWCRAGDEDGESVQPANAPQAAAISPAEGAACDTKGAACDTHASCKSHAADFSRTPSAHGSFVA